MSSSLSASVRSMAPRSVPKSGSWPTQSAPQHDSTQPWRRHQRTWSWQKTSKETERDGEAARGKKAAKAVAGIRARPSAARSAFGQTSHIEDAGGCARREDVRNEDRRPAIGLLIQPADGSASSSPGSRQGRLPQNSRTPRRAVPGTPSPLETWCCCGTQLQAETRHPRHADQACCSQSPPPRIVGEFQDGKRSGPTHGTNRQHRNPSRTRWSTVPTVHADASGWHGREADRGWRIAIPCCDRSVEHQAASATVTACG